MRGLRSGLFGIALLAGACTASGPENNAANQINLNAIMNALPPADCPEEELSCGKQRPVVSDGVTRFRNEDMYLSVVFPAGSQVCMTRSGDTPRGFFAIYGAAPGCQEPPRRPPRFIVLNTMYNAVFYETIGDAVEDCDPLSAETRQRLGGVPLVRPGFKILACETRGPAGAIEIHLNFLGGPWQEGETPRSRVRTVIYYFTFGTTPDHFDEDVARFRRVLASVRIATRN